MEVRPAGRPLDEQAGIKGKDNHLRELRFLIPREMFGRFYEIVNAKNSTASAELRGMLSRWMAEQRDGNA